jgi:hypothetical protein
MKADSPKVWFWFDAGYACGGLYTDEAGIIRGGAPIFCRHIGTHLNEFVRRLRSQGRHPIWQRSHREP